MRIINYNLKLKLMGAPINGHKLLFIHLFLHFMKKYLN
jgi:hypothetical protein